MNTWVEAPPRRKGLGCFARGCLQYGRLSLRKGEGEGEGVFRQVACAGPEPLTSILSPLPKGEAKQTRHRIISS
jgi:hypothetical protein